MAPSLTRPGGANLPLAFGLALAAGVVVERGLRDFSGAFGGDGGTAAAAPSGGGKNPLPGWRASVTDQGVDFAGGSRIFAPTAGKVLKVGAPGWPQGHPGTNGVLLQLADGTIMYFYEGLSAAVHAGQHVNAGELIARGIPGQSIEVGLADSSGVPLAHSWAASRGDPHTPIGGHGPVNPWARKAEQLLRSFGVAL